MLNLLRTGFAEPAVPTSPLAQWLQNKSELNSNLIGSLRQQKNAATQSENTASSHAECRPLITVVDDEAVIAVTLSELLSRHGFRAVWFTSALRAYEFVKQVSIDLLLSDLQMPEFDGWKLSQRVANIRSQCPVLFLSGSVELLEQIANMCAGQQNVCFAQKPIQVDALVTLIRQLLSDRREPLMEATMLSPTRTS